MKQEYTSELVRLGLKIKEVREQKSMTQQTLSSLCDIDVRTIQRIEKGKQNVSIIMLLNICKALEIDPDQIIKESLS